MKTKPTLYKRHDKTKKEGSDSGPITRSRAKQFGPKNAGNPVVKVYKLKNSKKETYGGGKSKIEDEIQSLSDVDVVGSIKKKHNLRKVVKCSVKNDSLVKPTKKVVKEAAAVLGQDICGGENGVIGKDVISENINCEIELAKIDENSQLVEASEFRVNSNSEIRQEEPNTKNTLFFSQLEKVRETPKIQPKTVENVDFQVNARKEVRNSLIFDKNNDDNFLPEVVIWGEQIKQTIKEVSNFFIVGSKESSVNRNDLQQSEDLKKIVNKPFTRRRAKPKPVQLMTLEEHKKILEACLRNPGGCDFKVDSLFRRGMDTRRRNSNQPIYIDTVETQDGPMVLETSTDPNSFTVGYEDGHIVIDDVANYECVDTSGTNGRGCSNTKSCNECEHNRRKRAPKVAIDIDGNWDPQCDEHGKPRCTYTDLIERALAENPHGLTVSEIYNWISTRFPYYSPTDDRWKNSVRHNLSINPYFKKGSKSKSGAGHVWTISEECQYFRPALKRRHTVGHSQSQSQAQGAPIDMTNMKTDTERAVASILGQYSKAYADENQNQEERDDLPEHNGITYCVDLNNEATIGTEGPSPLPNFGNAEILDQEQQYSTNQVSTIEFADLNDVMQSTCLLNLEDFSHGQVVYISQSDEEEANKENVHDSPIEYTILEASSFIENALTSPNEAHEMSANQLQNSSSLLTPVRGSIESERDISFNVTGSAIVDNLFGTDLGLSMPFHFDSMGNPVIQ